MNADKNNTQLPQSSVSVSAFLNGKAQTDFWKWYLLPETLSTHKLSSVFKYSNGNAIKVSFLAKSKTEQHSLIIEWFDSVGLLIGIYPNLYGRFVWHLNKSETYKRWSNDISYDSRFEATKECIEKLNELYNENVV